MLVLLEGSESVGKSTLAGVLQLEQGYDEYLHFSVPPGDPFEYYMNDLRNVKSSAVIDRCFWSHYVYRELDPDSQQWMDEHDRWLLEGWLLAHGCVIIKCVPPLTRVLETIKKERPNELYHDTDSVMWTYRKFLEPFDTVLPIINYDYTRDKIPVLPEREALSYDHVGIGSPRPKVVLVGERHNLNNAGCRDPIVFRAPSGNYLRETLNLAGLSLHDYHVTNALWGDLEVRPLTWPAAWDDSSKVVAMGSAASKVLTEQAIKHERVPHPSWWKRFKNKDMSGYAEAILTAAKL